MCAFRLFVSVGGSLLSYLFVVTCCCRQILVENGWLKIGSVGRGADIQTGQPSPLQLISQNFLPYAAPELLERGPAAFSWASDMWALGCILFEMVTGVVPFLHPTLVMTTDAILEVAIPTTPLAGLPADVAAVVRGLLQRDPLARLSWADVCYLPYFQGQLLHEGSSLAPIYAHARSLFAEGGSPAESLDFSTTINMASEQLQISRTSSVSSEGTLLAESPLPVFAAAQLPEEKSSRETHLSTDSDARVNLATAGSPQAPTQSHLRVERINTTFTTESKALDMELPRQAWADVGAVQPNRKRVKHTTAKLAPIGSRLPRPVSGRRGTTQAAASDRPTLVRPDIPFLNVTASVRENAVLEDQAPLQMLSLQGRYDEDTHEQQEAPIFRREQSMQRAVLLSSQYDTPSLPQCMRAASVDEEMSTVLGDSKAVQVSSRRATAAISDGPVVDIFLHHPPPVGALLSHDSDHVVAPILGNPKIAKLDLPRFHTRFLDGAFSTPEDWIRDADATAQTLQRLHAALQLCERAKTASRGSARSSNATPASPRAQASRLPMQALNFLQNLCVHTDVANIVINSDLVPATILLLKNATGLLREKLVDRLSDVC